MTRLSVTEILGEIQLIISRNRTTIAVTISEDECITLARLLLKGVGDVRRKRLCACEPLVVDIISADCIPRDKLRAVSPLPVPKICHACQGKGQVAGQNCVACDGSGKRQ